jgi:hypothetical protein
LRRGVRVDLRLRSILNAVAASRISHVMFTSIASTTRVSGRGERSLVVTISTEPVRPCSTTRLSGSAPQNATSLYSTSNFQNHSSIVVTVLSVRVYPPLHSVTCFVFESSSRTTFLMNLHRSSEFNCTETACQFAHNASDQFFVSFSRA